MSGLISHWPTHKRDELYGLKKNPWSHLKPLKAQLYTFKGLTSIQGLFLEIASIRIGDWIQKTEGEPSRLSLGKITKLFD